MAHSSEGACKLMDSKPRLQQIRGTPSSHPYYKASRKAQGGKEALRRAVGIARRKKTPIGERLAFGNGNS